MPLRQLALLRGVASLGAGGVLYLTPMVFHADHFSASSVGLGLALAALTGTVGRLVSGLLLDSGLNCSVPVLLAALLSLGGDSLLLGAHHFESFLWGQLLLGTAVGLYWPAVELAVPLCAGPMGSARGYALVRSADALGIALGALIGACLASVGHLRGIYGVDMASLTVLMALLLRRPLPTAPRPPETQTRLTWRQWIPPLFPVLGLSVLATAIPSLMQSALPLDLVRGGLARAAMPEGLGALLIGLQLALLVAIQWPVGRWMAERPVHVGLGVSLACFALGTTLLAVSSLVSWGLAVVVVAQIPLALGEAAFLPTATEAVVELSPPGHQGLAMALFSQCFALSAFGAPLVAGSLLDLQRHGAGLWLLVTVCCLLGLPLARRIERIQRRNLLASLTDQDPGGGTDILYRLDLGPRRRG